MKVRADGMRRPQGEKIWLDGERGGPPLREAANARSPNRKARWRGPLQRWTKEREKELVLRLFRVTGNMGWVARYLRRNPRTISTWMAEDAGFRAAVKEARAGLRLIAADELEAMTPAAMTVLREVLEGRTGEMMLDERTGEVLGRKPEDWRLKAEVAIKLLRGQGYLSEATVVEHTGLGGGPVRIVEEVVVRAPLGSEPKRGVMVEGGMRELGEG